MPVVFPMSLSCVCYTTTFLFTRVVTKEMGFPKQAVFRTATGSVIH